MKDVLDSIRERVANPLIFSFLASWLIANWRIIVGLFWFDSNDINSAGYYSLIDFIEKTINPYNGFLIPFFCAIGYVLLNPIVKNWIRAFHAWTTKWGEKRRLKILQDAYIGIDKYFSLKQQLNRKVTELTELINKESETFEEVKKVKSQYLKEKMLSDELHLKIEQLEASQNLLFNHRFLDGYWINSYQYPNGKKGKEEVVIHAGQYSITGTFNVQQKTFDISDFVYNPNTKQIFFIKTIVPELKDKVPANDRIHINRLELVNNDLLVGLEDGEIKIEYRKKLALVG
ncbi:MAG: hypothetical protein IM638_08350 [Bacteroidetes bacterium]|nr:hypothetical protein [Bacteroidota bacterium]